MGLGFFPCIINREFGIIRRRGGGGVHGGGVGVGKDKKKIF